MSVIVRRGAAGHGVVSAAGWFALAGSAAALVSIAVVPGPAGWLGGALAGVATAIAAVDRRSFVIPDPLTAAGLILGLVHAAVTSGDGAIVAAVADAAMRAGVSAAVFGLLWAVYRWLRGRDGLGLGDVKLAAVAGAWLGWPIIPVAVEIAALAALTMHAVRVHGRGRRLRARARLPFGQSLAPAIWIGWLIEQALLG
ncbi:prepilin peptidase [Rhodoplanes azumiensis]|uniref:Prepilin peptidase n=1 Tax=Rhodoplanes azumiensis TaxID=1897628 RepID=A0ABW5AL41_9BRAD